jgi:hypothetical protein
MQTARLTFATGRTYIGTGCVGLPRPRLLGRDIHVTAVINSYDTQIFRPPCATPTNEVTREGVQP